MTFKKISKILFPIVIIIAFIFIFNKMKNDQDALKTEHLSTMATINKWNSLTKSAGVGIDYSYTVNGTAYQKHETYGALLEAEAATMIGKQLQLIYSPKDPNNHLMLVSEAEYLFYHLPITDSAKAYFEIFK